jgi:hypothetical protein
MTSRGKRLTLVIGVAGLMVVVAASLVAPRTAAAASRRFTITTEEQGVDGGTSGTFVARGAIEGMGWAGQTFGIGMVLVGLRTDMGWINLEVYGHHGRKSLKTFEVVYASGIYAHLLGATGSYSYEVTYPDGPDGPFVIHRIFQGSVPK